MEIKELQYQVDSLQTVYSHIDVEFFKEINVEIQQNMEYVQLHFDAIDMKDTAVSKYIGAYGSLWKTLSRSMKKHGAALESNIAESEKQLSDLRYDVKKGIISNPEIIKHYIRSERTEVERLDRQVKQAFNQFSKHRKSYNVLQPKINELLKPLKKE